MTARIAIVDDDEPVRTSLIEVLNTYGYSATPFPSGADFLDSPDCSAYQCILLDLRMPGFDGLEVQRHLRERNLRTPVIFITGHGDIPLAVRAMRGGAFDFVEKPVHDDVLTASIQNAIAYSTLEVSGGDGRQAFLKRLTRLTPREKEVMDLVVGGHSSGAIGVILGISSRTADHHRARVLEKMEATSIANLIRTALRCQPMR